VPARCHAHLVDMAPDRGLLKQSFIAAGPKLPEIRWIDGMPFWLAAMTKG
jgi:hypothetical protein